MRNISLILTILVLTQFSLTTYAQKIITLPYKQTQKANTNDIQLIKNLAYPIIQDYIRKTTVTEECHLEKSEKAFRTFTGSFTETKTAQRILIYQVCNSLVDGLIFGIVVVENQQPKIHFAISSLPIEMVLASTSIKAEFALSTDINQNGTAEIVIKTTNVIKGIVNSRIQVIDLISGKVKNFGTLGISSSSCGIATKKGINPQTGKPAFEETDIVSVQINAIPKFFQEIWRAQCRSDAKPVLIRKQALIEPKIQLSRFTDIGVELPKPIDTPTVLVTIPNESPITTNTTINSKQEVIFSTNTFTDSQDAALGDNLCLDNYGKCSFRAAFMEAKNDPSKDYKIVLMPGQYEIAMEIDKTESNSNNFDIQSDMNIKIEGNGVDQTKLKISQSRFVTAEKNSKITFANLSISSQGTLYEGNGIVNFENSKLENVCTNGGKICTAIDANHVEIKNSNLTKFCEYEDNSACYGIIGKNVVISNSSIIKIGSNPIRSDYLKLNNTKILYNKGPVVSSDAKIENSYFFANSGSSIYAYKLQLNGTIIRKTFGIAIRAENAVIYQSFIDNNSIGVNIELLHEYYPEDTKDYFKLSVESSIISDNYSGGIRLNDDSNASVNNTIIFKNTSFRGAGIDGGKQVDVSYSTIFHNHVERGSCKVKTESIHRSKPSCSVQR